MALRRPDDTAGGSDGPFTTHGHLAQNLRRLPPMRPVACGPPPHRIPRVFSLPYLASFYSVASSARVFVMRQDQSPTIALNSERYDKISRIFAYHFSDFVLRFWQTYVGVVGNDLQKVIIFHTISLATAPIVANNPDALGEFASLRLALPAEMQVPCSALSVAEATGLPRETTRRKIKEMVADKLLQEDPRGGYRLAAGVLQRPEIVAIFEHNVRSLVRFANASVTLGALQIDG
ncbi:hypothetical protein [Segnochrobactrum spirostomi]|uniref:HTH iclR-type domain-containing protein n=1 Tax=Segnochrobactrum spirostomi TaxID=2608987 RepID=A0A6A7XY49_9HYPH|nr:hypothetical protein [Segnochrobactrum spirostomi]MQT11176.1 hypothetical protein [Segnochrobactrum spirostomi]